jgi:hypothetical protein
MPTRGHFWDCIDFKHLRFCIRVGLTITPQAKGQAFRSGAGAFDCGMIAAKTKGSEALMRKITGLAGVLAVLWTGSAQADGLSIGGHEITVKEDGMGSAALLVDGEVLHENGVIYLDEAVQTLGGVMVVTGVAGSGGNACGAAPFVLALPEGAAPALYGPLDSCREFTMQVQPDALVFSTEPLPSEPGVIWVWNPVSGLTEALPEEFSADMGAGWEAVPGLSGAHPVDAMKLAPVLAALQAGLGADYPAFAERISDLGSGDLTPEGYLGQACLKFTCEADWAFLYLHPATENVFVGWHVMGEIEPHIWPTDTNIWPDEAMAALRAAVDEG